MTKSYLAVIALISLSSCSTDADSAKSVSARTLQGDGLPSAGGGVDARPALGDSTIGSPTEVKGARPLRVYPPGVDQGTDAGEPGSGPTLLEWVAAMPKRKYTYLAEAVIDYTPRDLSGEGPQLGHPVAVLEVKQVFLDNPSGLSIVKGGPFILGNCTKEGLCNYDTTSPAYFSWGRVLMAITEDCWTTQGQTVQRVRWTLPIEGDVIYGFEGEESSWAEVEATLTQALAAAAPPTPTPLPCQPVTDIPAPAPDATNDPQDPNQPDAD